ncbi:MAG: DUF4838 domain-containing protein [Bacilli bacterium]|nr:DUF4838 domain-containing protein [Bacilli bacterium]
MKHKSLLLLSLLSLPVVSISGCHVDEESSKSEEKKYICDMLDQETPYAIVLPKESSETENVAANEIVMYFEAATGQTLQIINDSGVALTPESNYISIGKTRLWDSFTDIRGEIDLSQEALNFDGFALYTHNHCVLINSFNERGKYYGAIQFIQDTLGVKFLNYRYTHIPKLDSVELYASDKTYVPMFSQRAYLNTPVFNHDQEYTAHMRFNTDYCMLDKAYGGSTSWCDYEGNTSHTMASIIPAHKYYDGDKTDSLGRHLIKEEYREVFAHSGSGANATSSWYSDTLIDYCFTNGVKDDGTYDSSKEISTVKLVVEDLERRILQNPDCENYMIGQHDTPGGCPCDRCAESARKYKGGGRMVRFINVVAKEIKDWMKEQNIQKTINFCMFAYQYTIDPPVNENNEPIDETIIPRDDVYVKWAPINSAQYYAPNDPRLEVRDSAIDGWMKVTNRFHAWTYHCWYANSLWYYPTTQAFKDLMSLLKSAGVVYEFAQGPYYEYNLYQSDLDAYVFTNLCWDFSRSISDLMDEYNLYYFGKAAFPYIKEFHQELDDRYAAMAASGYNMAANNNLTREEYWPYQTTKKLVDCFDSAIEATLNDDSLSQSERATYIENLERASLSPLWMRLYMFDRYVGVDEEEGQLAKRFIDLGTKYSLSRYGEPLEATFASIKEKYGLN